MCNILSLISCAFSLQFDVTSYQGVLFVFCMVMFISGLVLAIVLPFQYVSMIIQSELLPQLHIMHCLN